MSRSASLLAASLTALALNSAFVAHAQTKPPAPVAYVYVDSIPSVTTAHIYGFAVAPNGRLSPISGSPFAAPVENLALNGKWLFGTYLDSNAQNGAIYSYSIAPNGSLKQAAITTVDPAFNFPDTLTLDHTGNSLYTGFNAGAGQNGYEAFSINQRNGKLTPLNGFTTGVNAYGNISFIGSNQYAYGSTSYGLSFSIIYGFARLSDGALSQLGINPPLPPAAPNNSYVTGFSTAADPYNDVVIPLFPGFIATNVAKPQLAVYTADKYGKLSTTSTYRNMPTPAVEPDHLATSPQGFYLAVSGYDSTASTGHNNAGLQIFLMQGPNPPKALTGAILPGTSLGQAFWDHYDHLFVLGQNKIYVFNISTHGITQAPGSPFVVPSAHHLIVLPK